MALPLSLCHPAAQPAESSRNISNWYVSWITDKRLSMMSFVYVGVLVHSKASSPVFTLVFCDCVCVRKCVFVLACIGVFVPVWISVYLSGCSFVFKNSLSISACVHRGRVREGRVSVHRLVCNCKCVWCLYRHWQVQQLCGALSCLFVSGVLLCVVEKWSKQRERKAAWGLIYSLWSPSSQTGLLLWPTCQSLGACHSTSQLHTATPQPALRGPSA